MILDQLCFYRCDRCKVLKEGFTHEFPSGWSTVSGNLKNRHLCRKCSAQKKVEEKLINLRDQGKR
jgi:hypothetical protein